MWLKCIDSSSTSNDTQQTNIALTDRAQKSIDASNNGVIEFLPELVQVVLCNVPPAEWGACIRWAAVVGADL